MSAPSARVVATSTARGAWRETQTPFSIFGARAGVSASAMRSVSPVGSRKRIGLSSEPAGVPSSETVSSIASRRPAALKRVGVDRRTERVAVLEQEAAGVGPGRVLAVVDRGERAARAQRRGERAATPRRARPRPRRRRARRLRCRSRAGARSRRSSAGRAAPPARASAPTAGTPTGRRRSGRARRRRAPPRRRRARARRPARRAAPAAPRRSSWPRRRHDGLRAATGSIVITERSPSASSTWTSRTVASRPETAPTATWPRRRRSRGTSSSVQRAGVARDRRLEQALERGAVAGERAADRLDDHRRFGRRVELHRAAALAEAHRQGVAVDGELLVARLQRLANEAVGRLEREASRRLQRAVEHLDPPRLDEGRLARLDAAEQRRQRAEVERLRARSARRERERRRDGRARRSSRRGSADAQGVAARGGRRLGIGPEVVEVEPVVRRFAAQRLRASRRSARIAARIAASRSPAPRAAPRGR